MPLSIDALVAFSAVQARVADWPAAIVVGLAARLPVGRGVPPPALPTGTVLVTVVSVSLPKNQFVESLV